MNEVYYKHKNCISTCVRVVKRHLIPDKEYMRIKVRWYSIHPHGLTDMRIETWLTNDGWGVSMGDRRKYPVKLWTEDWSRYEVRSWEVL